MDAFAKSTSWRGVLRELGLKATSGGAMNRTSRLLENYGAAAIGRANHVELKWLDELLLADHGGRISPESAGAIRGSIKAKLNDPGLSDELRSSLETLTERVGKRK
jgi:hypothetical protein